MAEVRNTGNTKTEASIPAWGWTFVAVVAAITYLIVCGLVALTTVNETLKPDANKPPVAHLGDTISMKIKAGDYVADKTYLLYIADTALTGIKPQITQGDQEYILNFRLQRNAFSEKAWNAVFTQLKASEPKLTTACVGPDDHSKAPTCVKDGMSFEVISKERLKSWGVVALIALAFFIRAITSEKSSVLRDWHPAGAGGALPMKDSNSAAAFSLGRVQMAFWTGLVVLAFIFIYLCTGDMPVLGASTLALLGIGSGTALGAALIDDNNKTPAPKTEGFLKDLLTSAEGYSFHRVQMLTWTLVLGVVFITSVMTTLSMPDFDNTLLALMGISSGAYLGFKFPESKSATPAKQDGGDGGTPAKQDGTNPAASGAGAPQAGKA